MATVSIRINQTGQPDGTPGVSRDNIVIGSELQVTDTGNGGGSFSWTYVGPADSVAVPTGLGTNDVRVTPDVAGTYLFFLNHDSETDLSYTKNDIDEWYSSQGGAAVLLPDGRRLPTEGETDQFDGWEEAMQANAKLIVRLKEDGNVVTGGPFTELNFASLGGGQVLVSGTGGGAATVTISGGGAAAAALQTTGADVVVSTSIPPTTGQVLKATSPTEAEWSDDDDISDVANHLGTTGANVTISGSVPPTAGQALVATDPTTAEWQDVAAGSADALSTTGTAVTVSGSGPPTIGQALVATSPTEATWQDVAAAGGGGANASAQGDYLHASLSAQQLDPAVSAALAFDTVNTSRGDLTVDGAGKFSGLKAGRTYMLTGNPVSTDTSANNYFVYEWYDVTAASSLPGSLAYSLSVTNAEASSPATASTAIITPTVDTELELRITAKQGTPDIRYQYSFVTIVEIGAVQAEVIGGMEFMDQIVITGSHEQTVTFGASGDGIHQRALDGDADERYVLITNQILGGGTGDVRISPNGTTLDNTNSETQAYVINNGVQSAGSEVNYWFARLNSGNAQCNSRVEINAKTGLKRTFESSGQLVSHSTIDTISWFAHGVWDDDTTNITSLELTGSVADVSGIGTIYTLYRMSSQNVRADSADTYIITGSDVAVQGTNVEGTAVTLGRTSYGGSLLSTSVSLEEAVTGGTVTVRTKVNGVTKQTAVLSTSATEYRREVSSIGAVPVVAGDKITFTVETSSYTNGAALDSGVVVNITLQNGSLTQAPILTTNVAASLADPPEVAHADDDEFESTTLDAAWSVTPAISASAVDPYAAFASGGTRIDLHTDRRPSWMMWQAQNDGTASFISKPFTFPTNVFVWTRMTFNHRYNQATSNDGNVAMRIGNVANTHSVTIYLNESDGGDSRVQVTQVGGSGSTPTLTNIYNTGQGLTLEYVGIQKLGTVYHCWVGTATGAWKYITAITNANTFDMVHFFSINNSSTAPGNTIMGVDFIRFVESATFLP